MIRYILKRLVHGFLVTLGVVTVVFFLFHAMPGEFPINLPPAQREAFMQELGLRDPLPVQYIYYLNDLSPLSFHENTTANKVKYGYFRIISVGETTCVLKAPYLRRSFMSNRRVDDILWDGLLGSAILGASSMSFALLFGIFFGVVAALNHQKFWDNFMVTISVVGISAPSFVSAILISMLFGFYLSEYTNLNTVGYLWIEHPLEGRILQLKNLILPTIALGVRPLAIITQLMRSSMLEVMSEDYIRTARAKGLSKPMIVVKHALKNGIKPVVTAVSGWLVSVLGGAFFIEYIFQWKGLGFKTIQAVTQQDFPIIMGATLVVAVIFVLVNIIVDVLVAFLDPRVRLE